MDRLRTGFIAAVVLIAAVVAYRFFNPPSEAGVRLINGKADDHEVAKVGQARPELNRLVGGDDRKFGDALKDFGSEDGARQADRQAALSRATGAIPVRRQQVVWGGDQAPRTVFPAYEDILVVLSPNDQVWTGSRPDESSRADGIYKGRWDEAFPNRKSVLQVPHYGGREDAQPGDYHAHIARLCNHGTCGDWVQTGFVYAVCGSRRPGDEQQWLNGVARVGRLEHTNDFFGGRGYYTFEAKPDPMAAKACRDHPGADIVPNLSLDASR